MKKQEGLLRAGKVFLILLFIAGFFYLGESCWAADHIVISNFATHGPGGARDEFVELYNPTSKEINLEGWKLQTKSTTGDNWINRTGSSGLPVGIIFSSGYYLLAAKDYSLSRLPNYRHSANWGLADSGGYIRVIDNLDQEIDKISYGDVEIDQGSESGAEGNEETQTSPAEEPEMPAENPPNSLYQGDETTPASTTPTLVSYKLGDVVINELVSDPADGEVEWIELYNATGEEIDLSGWTIEEGSGAKTNLSGVLAASGKEKFLVIEKPKGNLNNKGDIVILRALGGILIDQVAYGNWDDGNLENNAPAPSDPNSIARKFDGQNSFNNLNDFAVTVTPTKGTGNIITGITKEEDEISDDEKNLYDFSNDIIISEIFPNPVGSDNEEEFIELYNRGTAAVDLRGWGVGDDSKGKYKFKEDIFIKGGEYLAVSRSESKIALNNNGDKVKLYLPLADNPLETVEYNKAEEGWSYNFATSSQDWVWSEIITPGEANVIKAINHPPLVSFYCPKEIVVGQPILFDSSDTVDEDGDKLEFSWDFGDGIKLDLASPEHTYLKSGNYSVKLIVCDGENEASKEEIIKVGSVAGDNVGLPSVIINEILPDPEGSDSEEWIELKNIGSNEVNLLGWQLDDIEGGSQPYKISSDLWLEPGDFYLLERNESGLALNNSNESVRLFNNLGDLIDEVGYEKSYSGESYSRDKNGKWFWTTALTPGEENIISVAGSKSNGSENVLGVKVGSSAAGEYVPVTLEKIKEAESGDLVKVEGTVAVLPGILGAQYFYIVGSPGVQVYNYNKDFPDLKIGDYIEVSGEVSVSSGEKRIKTKQKDDMKIIENRQAPQPAELPVEKITEDWVGGLVSITGEVTDRKSSTVYLDDGTDEIRVYIKEATGIKAGEIKEGETLAIAGIVSRTESGLRVMPRSPDDIIKKDAESQGEAGQVLGEVAESDEWPIATRDKKLELFKYLLVLAGGIIIILGGLLVKEFRGNRGG
ncbi:MAG: lamin tail domain-containing protein [Patescibacteria group bacterium]|nr:lamin tail domain-containing protein [Patescibacteria group bacterium]MDD5554238.1 lamin tail domain-containing protein [Patescibacteria group bacterium]